MNSKTIEATTLSHAVLEQIGDKVFLYVEVIIKKRNKGKNMYDFDYV